MQFSLNLKTKSINCVSKIKINKTNVKNNKQGKEHSDKTEILKMVKLTKKNFLLVDNDKCIYYLKKPNK